MKKTIYFLAIFAILSACSGSELKTGNNEQQTADKTAADLTGINTEKPTDIAYTQCPLAYLVHGELYFHSLDENKKVKFSEEPDAIFNFTFDTEGKTLYYSVERDSSLWLKAADISDSKVTPQWVVDWKLKKDDCITDTYGESSPLLYHDGELLIEHNFEWDYYDFRNFVIYSFADEERSFHEKESDARLIQKFIVELPWDKAEKQFKTTKQQLYYTHKNAKVCLTDTLDIDGLKGEGDGWVKTEFHYFTFSPDEKKVLFGALLAWGDLPHGPYCIANLDGSRQFILEEANITYKRKPVWLKNNSVAFTNTEENLFIANNDDNSLQKIAENVTMYMGR